jgi:hypothetical protein
LDVLFGGRSDRNLSGKLTVNRVLVEVPERKLKHVQFPVYRLSNNRGRGAGSTSQVASETVERNHGKPEKNRLLRRV